MRTTVVTDSAASLPPETLDRLGIVVVPLEIVIGGVEYTDGALAARNVVTSPGGEVTTSAPSPGDFAKAIDNHRRPAVVITVASSMSSTYEAAVLAASYFDEGEVHVVDSGTAAGAEGLAVLAAGRRAAAGVSTDEVVAVARRVAGKVRLVGALEHLDALARSGRVPGTAAWAGDVLGARALFEFAGGRARPRRPAFGTEAALERIVDSIGQPPPGSPSVLRVAVLHAEAEKNAERLTGAIRDTYPGADLFVAPFSAVMVAHTGPGLVGAAWWWDDEAVSTGSMEHAD